MDNFQEQSVLTDLPETVATDRFPCPQCGADMTFNVEQQALACAYCGHHVEIEGEVSEVKEYDLADGEDMCSSDWGNTVKVIHCESCGAQTILEAHSAAQSCSFCGSSHVMQQDAMAGIRPETVIPFQVSVDAAKQAFNKWIGSHFFAPGDLKTSYRANPLRGIYIPFWTYDTDTYSLYKAERGTHYWVTQPITVMKNGKHVTEQRRVRRTRWRFVSGTYGQFYNDELIHASKRLDDVLQGRVGRYDLSKLMEYRPEYLSGFAAEKYSIGLQEGWERAKDSIKSKISQGITRQINGDEVRGLRFTTSFDQVRFKHTLLPLWMSAYTYNDKVYRFLINGQSGEVHGEAPVSALKVAIAVLLGVAAVALFFYLSNNQ